MVRNLFFKNRQPTVTCWMSSVLGNSKASWFCTIVYIKFRSASGNWSMMSIEPWLSSLRVSAVVRLLSGLASSTSGFTGRFFASLIFLRTSRALHCSSDKRPGNKSYSLIHVIFRLSPRHMSWFIDKYIPHFLATLINGDQPGRLSLGKFCLQQERVHLLHYVYM